MAMVRNWQLMLVGMAVAPVLAGIMALQAALVASDGSQLMALSEFSFNLPW
jgi:hypothetical protein